MGHSQADKAQTHERIVEIAARRMREQGLEGVGVAELMKEAGLTVGGFYKHFASRDALVAEAMQATFEASNAQSEAKQGKRGIRRSIEDYLAPRHRDGVGTGCSFSALSSDLARSDDKTRRLASAQLQKTFARYARELGGVQNPEAREKAILSFSAMVGAVALARVIDDKAQSGEVLEAVRRQLLKLLES